MKIPQSHLWLFDKMLTIIDRWDLKQYLVDSFLVYKTQLFILSYLFIVKDRSKSEGYFCWAHAQKVSNDFGFHGFQNGLARFSRHQYGRHVSLVVFLDSSSELIKRLVSLFRRLIGVTFQSSSFRRVATVIIRPRWCSATIDSPTINSRIYYVHNVMPC